MVLTVVSHYCLRGDRVVIGKKNGCQNSIHFLFISLWLSFPFISQNSNNVFLISKFSHLYVVFLYYVYILFKTFGTWIWSQRFWETTNLGGGEAPLRILLLCDPLHNVRCRSQLLWAWGRLGQEVSQEHIGCHLHLSRGSLGFVKIPFWCLDFLRSFPVDGVVLRVIKRREL